jgi:sugar phosphate isomerase/epimerase
MRLSCLPVSFFPDLLAGRMNVAEWARIAVQQKLDAIDLSILFVPDRSLATAAALRRQIEGEGTRVAMVTTYPDFTHPDPVRRKEEVQHEADAVAISAELGADMVRVTAGQAHPSVAVADGIRWAAEGLQALCEAVQGLGVTLVYENHAKPMVWEYTDFCQPPDIFLEIVRRTRETNLKINFDAGNAATYSNDPVGLLCQVIDRVYSIHASDSALRGELVHVLLGTGITPYPELFSYLRASGWDGWICMEENSRQGEQGVAQAASFIRKTWQEAVPSVVT